MKYCTLILCAALFLSGCGQPKYQTNTLAWWAGYTNLELAVFYRNVETKTNVTGLTQAADILGKYGWQLTTVSGNNANTLMYLKRQYRGNDTCTFGLTPAY